MTNTVLVDIMKAFAQFVPKETLRQSLVQPDVSAMSGYSELAAELLAIPDGNVIEDIGSFVYSINRSWVSDSIRSSSGMVLFVEYGTAVYDASSPNRALPQIAVTVAQEYTMSNKDNLSELLIMDKCFNTLLLIISVINDNQLSLDSCSDCKIVESSCDLIPIDSEDFFSKVGWTAFFNKNTK